MIEETKALLRERNVTRAVIVDDAFDVQPRFGDIEGIRWDRFFDDMTDDDEASLKTSYGTAGYDTQDSSQLRRDTTFISVAWLLRDTSAAARALFEDFEQTQERKRSDLAPLLKLLEELGLSCEVSGRDGTEKLADAQIIFLDLFLGREDDADAVSLAIERVRHVIASRGVSPPSVVLMSASPHLSELAPQVRDQAELLGCLFRTVRKTALQDAEATAEQIYDLVFAYQDAVKLNTYVLAWDEALTEARTRFLRTIRTLDLSDYSNLHELTLKAEEEQVGDYVVDLYDLHLHSVVEGQEALLRAAKALNSIEGGSQPPGQFMPNDQVVKMMDAAMFFNETRTRIEVEDSGAGAVHLGDVFMAPTAGDQQPRYAYVVLSQACDLQHAEVDRVLLLRGVMQPYAWKQHVRAKVTRTPVMTVGDERFMIDWDPLAPETWLLTDLERKVTREGFKCVRRFRAPFALSLQQTFIGKLGRVGTLAALPARFEAGVRIYVRPTTGDPLLLAETPRDAGHAVCLVGRTKNDLKEWLLIDETFLAEIRAKLSELDDQTLRTDVAAARSAPQFFRLLKRGLEFRRGDKDGAKPLKDSAFDVVQIYTTHRISANLGITVRPIVIEIDAE
jgi:hypothetical protein